MADGQPTQDRNIQLVEPGAWDLKDPVVAAPIVGATNPHHLTDASLRSTCIWPDEVPSLEEPYTPRQTAGF